jgi:hypothetical protein
MTADQRGAVKQLALAAIVVVFIGGTYAGGSAYWKAHKRDAVRALVSKSIGTGTTLSFRRYASFGHEYCQEVIIAKQDGNEVSTMRIGPRSWDSGPLVVRGAYSSFEKCQHDARG